MHRVRRSHRAGESQPLGEQGNVARVLSALRADLYLRPQLAYSGPVGQNGGAAPDQVYRLRVADPRREHQHGTCGAVHLVLPLQEQVAG